MGDETSELPPAGWYEDPAGAGGTRYWDGTAWTHQVKPAADALEVVTSETAIESAGGTPLEGAVHELQTTHSAATRQPKVCRKGSRQATDAYNTRVRQATKLVEQAQRPEPVALLRGKNNILELTTVTLSVGGVTRDLHEQVTTQVDTEGNLAISSRSTFTRMGLGTLLAGPFGLVAGASARKSSRVDERGLYLLIDGGDWAHVEPVDPNQGQAARSFGQQVMVAARGADAARARRAQELAAARANLQQIADDRTAIEAASNEFERERQAAQLQLATTAQRVQLLLEDADPSSKEARRASKALSRAAELPTKVSADLDLPGKLATVDQTSVLPSGQTAREELLALTKRLPGTTHVLTSRQFDAVARELQDGERPLLVVAARRGRSPVAVAVTSARLLSGVGQEVETVSRTDIASVSTSNAFTGGKLVLRLTNGTSVEVTGISPVASITELERILKSPVAQLQAVTAPEGSSEDEPEGSAAVAEMDEPVPEQRAATRADPIALLRQLSELHESGVLTDEEFASKKQELLARM